MIRWTDEQLKAAGIDRGKLTALLGKLDEVRRLMGRLGLSVYTESGCVYLIHDSRPEHTRDGAADYGAIVANGPVGRFDGGGW